MPQQPAQVTRRDDECSKCDLMFQPNLFNAPVAMNQAPQHSVMQSLGGNYGGYQNPSMGGNGMLPASQVGHAGATASRTRASP
eukprot:766653-Hanusia_phi.AAC.12